MKRFFVRTDLGSVTFVCDAQGHVSGYTCHRVDGLEIYAGKSNEAAKRKRLWRPGKASGTFRQHLIKQGFGADDARSQPFEW
jgi:hypothetical protein